MAVKTFGSEILTSGDVNTYLANSGLVYIKQQTIGSGVSSVTVTDAFSSAYDNYRIIYQAGGASALAELLLKFTNSSGATYSHGGVYIGYGSITVFGETANNVSTGIRVGNTNPSLSSVSFDVFNPYAAAATQVVANHADATYWSARGGRDSNAASQTAFSLQPSSGTMTGGIIYVMGYRKS